MTLTMSFQNLQQENGTLLLTKMLHLKNCAPFTRCVTHINDEHVETAENLDLIMSMYNLIKYSDKYADSYGSLYQFKRD